MTEKSGPWPGTVTGRLSTRQPNYSNGPGRDEPRTMNLKQVLEAAERASEQVSKWPSWKQKIMKTSKLVNQSPTPPQVPQPDRFHLKEVKYAVLLTDDRYLCRTPADQKPHGPFADAVHFYSEEQAFQAGLNLGETSFTVVTVHCQVTYEVDTLGSCTLWTSGQ